MNMYDCRIRREHGGDNARMIVQHQYDPKSGWCLHNCGCRSDGRVIKVKSGEVLAPGHQYTDADMRHFAAWLAEREPARTGVPARGVEPELRAWTHHLIGAGS